MARIIPEGRQSLHGTGAAQRELETPQACLTLIPSATASTGRALRKLFVGMTRATMKLVMVVSERAALSVLGKLDNQHCLDMVTT